MRDRKQYCSQLGKEYLGLQARGCAHCTSRKAFLHRVLMNAWAAQLWGFGVVLTLWQELGTQCTIKGKKVFIF